MKLIGSMALTLALVESTSGFALARHAVLSSTPSTLGSYYDMKFESIQDSDPI
jgi:hypothetical protein